MRKTRLALPPSSAENSKPSPPRDRTATALRLSLRTAAAVTLLRPLVDDLVRAGLLPSGALVREVRELDEALNG